MRGKLVLGISVLPLLLSVSGCRSTARESAAVQSAPATATATPGEGEKKEEGARRDEPAAPAPVATTVPAASAAAPHAPRPATAAARKSGALSVDGEDFGGGGLGLAGTGTGTGGGGAAPSRGGWAPPPPSQLAGVKAGEWDDNANYREFTRFLASSRENYNRVNLENRRFLVVRDNKGLGIPRCKITVRDTQQRSTSFVTNAAGRAILFPHAEGLAGDKLVANADCAEGKAEASFATFQEDDGLVDLKVQTERRPIGVRAIDVAFVLDTTGSMSEEITAVKATIQKVARSLSNEQTTVRIGLVEYKDRTDPFVTKVYPFSNDLSAFSRKVDSISASGGGDTPEDMNAGLHSALTELSWNNEAVARLAFVIADAPPHLDYQGASYAVDMKTASHRGIQLFTVAASGMDGLGQVVMRQMAQYTGGTNMFVLRGGAGPQSTGGGDPTSSCGGTHTNYSSGKLDELIVQKIRRELRAIDADPMRIAGLGKDENAKPCDQRVVFRD